MTEINADDLLKPFRREIDALDRQLIKLLGARFDVVRRVGQEKAKYNLPPVQPKRMEDVLDHVAALAVEQNLDPKFVRHLYCMMIDHAHELEFDIADDAAEGSDE